MGVKYLVLDFARSSRTFDDMLRHMEAFATQVRAQV